MTETGDGLAAVSAMHNKNPDSLTLVYTGYPELQQALDAILSQSDDASEMPNGIPSFPEPIHLRAKNRELPLATIGQRVAAILERDVFVTITNWLDRIKRDGELTRVPLSKVERTGHFPILIWELAQHLRTLRKLGAKAVSEASIEHGKLRQLQGYSISMIVEEFRLMQVCIFETLYNSLSREDFRLVFSDAKTITDECDSQLKQTLASFTRQAARGSLAYFSPRANASVRVISWHLKAASHRHGIRHRRNLQGPLSAFARSKSRTTTRSRAAAGVGPRPYPWNRSLSRADAYVACGSFDESEGTNRQFSGLNRFPASSAVIN
jgi:hypothetical protein